MRCLRKSIVICMALALLNIIALQAKPLITSPGANLAKRAAVMFLQYHSYN